MKPTGWKERYSRQILLPEIGLQGQKKLMNSTVLIVGCGGLGTVVANNLTRSGVGIIKIIDRDVVELNNLQRQILFTEEDIGHPKAEVAAEKLRKINSTVHIVSISEDINSYNAENLLKDVDIVIDCTDNMETRFIINDVCIKNNIPWIYGGVVGKYGMTLTILPKKGPCFRCFIPEIPHSLPTCDTIGILNAIPMIIGGIESNESLKILLGKDVPIKLIIYDLWRHEFRQVKVVRNINCRCCSHNQFDFLAEKNKPLITPLCGKEAIQIIPQKSKAVSFSQLNKKLIKLGKVKYTQEFLSFKAQEFEILLFKNGRAIISGTTDINAAKEIYQKYTGIKL
jgi:adenylyltransferase/sulfurtransferase